MRSEIAPEVHALPQNPQDFNIALLVAPEENHMLLTRAEEQTPLYVIPVPIEAARVGHSFDGFI
jgi:hypothetical protein